MIVATMGENDGAGTMCPSSAITESPAPMPRIAVISGRPIASSDPKAMSKTIPAAMMPAPWLGPPYGVSARSITSPPMLNLVPSADADLASEIRASASLSGMADGCTPNWIVENAICPSAEIWPGTR